MLSLALLFAINGIQASIVWDGRLPKGTTPEDFEKLTSPYQTDGYKSDQPWSKIITTDCDMPLSQYDDPDYQSFQIQITDKSVYPRTPGFRRADLNPKLAPDADINVDTTTFYFSVYKNDEKPLDLSHQYVLVYLESDEFQNFFELRYGTDYGQEPGSYDDANQLRIYGTPDCDNVQKLLYQVEFTDAFHNFAITIDWEKETIAVYHSVNSWPLVEVVSATPNRVLAPAELSIGLLKYPIGSYEDPAHDGKQDGEIDEAIIYGGVFITDSAYEYAESKAALTDNKISYEMEKVALTDNKSAGDNPVKGDDPAAPKKKGCCCSHH